MRVLVVGVALVALGCASGYRVDEEGRPIVAGTQIDAVATPLGPIYFGPAMGDARTVAHEMCHVRRARKMGWGRYYYRYLSDPAWACSEERVCGWYGRHPVCEVARLDQ